MGEQGKWFKLWCATLTDQNLENLELEDWARWVRLGAYIKKHGVDGKICFEPPARALLTLFRVPDLQTAIMVLKRFPNCALGERETTVTTVTPSTVTLKIEYTNWLKYQGDYSNDRVRKFRDKKRHRVTAQEETRRDEKRREEITPPEPTGSVADLISDFHFRLTERLGEKPSTFNGGALGRTLKAALRTCPVEEIKKRIGAWFDSTEPFIVAQGYSTTLFTSKFSLLKGGPIHANESNSAGHHQGVKPAAGKYESLIER